MKPDYYILEGRTPIPVADVREWGRWLEGQKGKRHVADMTLPSGVRVSTVFLGLDHSFGDGPPMLFETLIFGGPSDGEMWRYSTWEEAETGHKVALALAEAGAEP